MFLGICIETYIFTSQERFACSDMYVWYVYSNMYFLMRMFVSHDWFVHSNMSIIYLLYVYDIMICMYCDIYFVTFTFTSQEWFVCSDMYTWYVYSNLQFPIHMFASHDWFVHSDMTIICLLYYDMYVFWYVFCDVYILSQKYFVRSDIYIMTCIF